MNLMNLERSKWWTNSSFISDEQNSSQLRFELLRWVWSERMWMLSSVWWLRRQPHLAQVTSLSLFGRSVVFLSPSMQPHLWWRYTCIFHISTSTPCPGLGVIHTVRTCRLRRSKRRGRPSIVKRSYDAQFYLTKFEFWIIWSLSGGILLRQIDVERAYTKSSHCSIMDLDPYVDHPLNLFTHIGDGSHINI